MNRVSRLFDFASSALLRLKPWNRALLVIDRKLLVLTCLAAPCFAGDVEFRRHVINATTDYSAAALMDVDHDGDIDIVCGGEWYSSPNWEPHFLADIPRIGGRPDGFAHLPFDVNRDGWTDIITVNYRSRSIRWMQHPGPSLGPWTIHVAVEPGAMETGRLVDIDRDGKLDLLPNGAHFAAWWEFRWGTGNGPTEPAWIRHDLPVEAGGHGLGFGDVNGDGRGDIVGQHGWLEAPDDARNGSWQWHPDFHLERGSIPMLVVDADEDGDNDIVWCSAHGFGTYWLEHSFDAGQDRWERHAIDTSWSQGHSPLWEDFDGDGRMELLTGKRYMAHGGADPGEYDPLVIYRYEFRRDTRTWDRWTVSDVSQRVGVGLDPKAGDIDRDGDLDLLVSGRSGLYLLENLTRNTDGVADSAIVSDTNDASIRSGARTIPSYDDHRALLVVKDFDGTSRPIDEPEAWGLRRSHILSAIESEHGALPPSAARVPLNRTVTQTVSHETFELQQIEYQVDSARRVMAELLLPSNAPAGQTTGIVCLFEPDRQAWSRQVASELASHGFVCVAPVLADVAPGTGSSSVMDGVWQAMRAADLLQAIPAVHGERIGFVGDAIGGQVGLFVAATDQRFLATVSDLSSATPIAEHASSTYSLAELLACVAPRSLQLCVPHDEPLAMAFRDEVTAASPVFALRRATGKLAILDVSLAGDMASRAPLWESLKESFRP